MINLLIPIVDKPEEYVKSILAVAGRKDVNIFVGTVRELENKLSLPKSVKVEIFKNGSQKEEILNALQESLLPGKVVVARRPFSEGEFTRISTSDTQVTYLEKPKEKKVTSFFKKMLSNIVKFLFGIDFFDGDISLICFDKDLGDVLKSVANFSYATRVDRWRGVEQSAVKSDFPASNVRLTIFEKLKLIILCFACVLVPLELTLLLCLLTKITFILGMLLFCVWVLGLCGFVLSICTIYFNMLVGKRFYKKAEKD